jgi:hypothetical protein
MSNEIKTGVMNDQSGAKSDQSGGNKNAQQSQSTTPRTDKGMPQQGGVDRKSGQQSQGETQSGSRSDDGLQQAGSAATGNDAKKASDATQKTAQPK